jgi:hypothetical protein
MSFYTRSTINRSDAHYVKGMYINPNNLDELFNFPYTNYKENLY